MTFKYNGLVWFQTIGLKETAVSDQSRFQANGGAVYNTPGQVGKNFVFALPLCGFLYMTWLLQPAFIPTYPAMLFPFYNVASEKIE